MNELVKNPYNVIDGAKNQFQKIIEESDSGVDWEKESVYAYQALVKNDYTLNVAINNPASVKMAVINIASVGLSLNPATSYAYLVPRGGAICLDIGYQGLIKIATDTGSILWAKADLIYEGDEFIYKGPAEKPEIKIDPFRDRDGTEGFKGVFCIAKTHDGDYLVETISAQEIFKIRDEASESGKKGKGPWFTYFGEMAKKAVIKRASKTWPKTERHERIQKAIEVINETEGSDWAKPEHRFKPGEAAAIVIQMRDHLADGDELGVQEITEEYLTGDPEEQMKFWALFTSTERAAIKNIINDIGYQPEAISNE